MINFLQPAAFFLAALLPIIVLLYLLKLRRTERPVSSTYLWRQMVRDVEANAPWQRLRFNLLMVLQLIFLALLILALARPAVQAQGVSAQTVILILDASASMTASDVVPTRFEAAKDQAQRIVAELPEQARVTLIVAGQEARVVIAASADRRQLRQGIASLRPGAGSADMSVALQLASAIAARQPDAQIIVLSDGNVPLPQRITVQGKLTFLPIGLRNQNQAVSLLNVQPEPSGALSAFAQITNYGDQTVKRRLAFYADGLLVDTFDVDLPPTSEKAVLAQGILDGTQVVEARLMPPESGEMDFLTADDSARVIYQPGEPISVTLVSPGNLFLETALSLLPSVQLTRLNAAEVGALPAADLTILDGQVSLTTTLPAGNLLFIAPTRSNELFTVAGALTQPRPRKANQDDPLLQYIDLETVNILDAVAIPLPDWARPVIFADLSPGATSPIDESPPLLFVGETGGRRLAVLSFDLRRSDLPLQVAFPLLLSNLMDYLAPGRSGAFPQSVSPGAILDLPLPQTFNQLVSADIVLTRPDGSQTLLQPDENRLHITETSQLGLYRVQISDALTLFYAVNLFSPLESRIAPQQNLPVSGLQNATAEEAPQTGQRELWRTLAMFALFLLFLEWLIYHRPTLSRLWQHLRAVTPRMGNQTTGSRRSHY
jgi:hypothetical protein